MRPASATPASWMLAGSRSGRGSTPTSGPLGRPCRGMSPDLPILRALHRASRRAERRLVHQEPSAGTLDAAGRIDMRPRRHARSSASAAMRCVRTPSAYRQSSAVTGADPASRSRHGVAEVGDAGAPAPPGPGALIAERSQPPVAARACNRRYGRPLARQQARSTASRTGQSGAGRNPGCGSAAIARTMPGVAIARYPSIVLDCPDPGALATFYGAMLGWKADISPD